MDVALDIAMNVWTARSGSKAKEVRWKRGAWKSTVRHRIKLDHAVIKALERKAERFLEDQTRA
jgi:hypothetical protein